VYIGLFVGREYWVGIVLKMGSVLGWRSRSRRCRDTKYNAVEAISLNTTVNSCCLFYSLPIDFFDHCIKGILVAIVSER
jgi:hypothetical protein